MGKPKIEALGPLLLLVSALALTVGPSALAQIPRHGCLPETAYEVREIPIPPSPYPTRGVLVHNGIVLYEEIISVGPLGVKVINGYNFETGERLRIGPESGVSFLGGASNEVLAYTYHAPGKYDMKTPFPADIRVVSLTTGQEETVATSPLSGRVRISGNDVAWENPLKGIFSYDLEKRESRQITAGVRRQFLVDVSVGTVFFQKYDDPTIFGYDLSAGKEFPIVSPATSWRPTIYGNLLVWGDAREGDWDIYAYDLRSRREFALVVAPGNQSRPIVGSDIVVWSEEPRFGGGSVPVDIFGYDLRSQTAFSIARNKTVISWTDKSLWRNVLAWVEQDPRFSTSLGGQVRAVSINLPRQWQLSHGCFFTQTSGLPEWDRSQGYSVINDPSARFWDEFQRLGSVDNVGYPMSRRFLWGGFTTQVFQRAIFQWQSDAYQVYRVYFVNVFDDLHDKGFDDWLLAFKSIPKPLDPSFDQGKSQEQVIRDRLALLDEQPAFKAKYYQAPIDPMLFYGLPTSRITDMGNHYAMRLQRAVFQLWKEDVPWARAGEVTIALGGAIAAEAGLFGQAPFTPEEAPLP